VYRFKIKFGGIMKKCICTFVVLFFAGMFIFSEQYFVGSSIIDITNPEGFQSVSTKSEYYNYVVSMLPSSGRLIDLFILNEEKNAVETGNGDYMYRYIYFTTMPKYENLSLTKEVLDEVKKQVYISQLKFTDSDKKKYGDIVKKYLDRKGDHDLSVDVKIPESLGVLFSSDYAIGFMTVSQMKLVVDHENVNTPNMAIGCFLCLVKGKIINGYICSQIKSNTDLEWVKTKTEDIASAILKQNSR
jgi:hypothetical protein